MMRAVKQDQPKPETVVGLLSASQGEFREKFNSKSFLFKHRMANSALFSIPRLASIAERMLASGDLKKFVALGGKNLLAKAKFSAMAPHERLAETVRQIATANVWLKLSSSHTADPEHNEILQEILRELEVLAGVPLRKHITWSALTVFMASPGVTTPYHIDHESNFLFQISGAKDVTLFDPADREVVPSVELERFYVGNVEAAQYRAELAERATAYRLIPGAVVHHPPLAPHWVQNGNDVSISVSIGFCMRSIDRRARIHQVNHFLRRMGLRPTVPGVSRFRDEMKMLGIGLVSMRKPTSPDEILYSGITRLTEPIRAVKQLFSPRRPAKR